MNDKPTTTAESNRQGMLTRRMALSVLQQVQQAGAFSNLALKHALAQTKLDSRDAAFVSKMVYTTLENLIRLDYIIGVFSTAKELYPTVRDILRLSAAQILFLEVRDAAAIDTGVELIREAEQREQFHMSLTGFVNAVLRKIAARKERIPYPDPQGHPLEYLSVRYSLPKDILRMWLKDYGQEFVVQMMEYERDNARTTLRVNRLKTTAEQAKLELEDNGCVVQPAEHADALYAWNVGDLIARPIYRDGLVTPMGEASMLVCDALAAKPGQRVLDACAAPGGKTALIAQYMEDNGKLTAWDVHEHRVRLTHNTLKRLGVQCADTAVQDAILPVAPLVASQDAVLVDAPCSGLGVVGAKPDIALRKTAADFASLAELQSRILRACSRYVKPGGRLVYSTCTISRRENQGVVGRFLAEQSEFSEVPPEVWLPKSIALRLGEPGPGAQLFPHLTDLDGFYIAVMERKA